METIKKSHIPWTESKYLYYGILLFWLIINLIQAQFTELIHDEAYYYFYSKVLAWGYFDHPPMTALFIKIGSFFFSNELGVRILFSLSSVLALVLFMEIAQVKNYFLFFVLWFSLLMIQVGGFLAVPDVPLIFFSALFFLSYRNYLENDSWNNILFLSLSIAALFYSKYIGVLIVFFTVLSNLKLLKQKSFWFIALISTVLLLPHLWWQIQHDFVTVHYHMVERGIDNYFKWRYVFDYMGGQIGILNPLIAFFLLYFGIKFKPENDFQKALKFNAFGTLLFGFLMSFNGPVEANWTSPAIVPLLIIAYQGIQSRKKIIKIIYVMGAVSALLIFPLRGFLMTNFIQSDGKEKVRNELHDWDLWAKELKEKVGDKPVIFVNSYQRASKYFFYADNDAFTFTTIKYRKSQFDIDNIEEELQGKDVFFCHEAKFVRINEDIIFPIPVIDSIETSIGKRVYYTTDDDFRSYNYLDVDLTLADDQFKAGSTIEVPITINNNTGETIIIKPDTLETYITVAIYQRGQVLSYQEVKEISNLKIPEHYSTSLDIKIPNEPGEYYMRIAIRSGWLPPGFNSPVHTFFVKQ